LASESARLQQQLADPLGGGIGADFADRVRVQQAQAGLLHGRSAAFQEAAALTQAGQQRQMQAAHGLVNLSQNLLGQAGILDFPDPTIAALGNAILGSETLDAIKQAGEEQSKKAEELFKAIMGQLGGGGSGGLGGLGGLGGGGGGSGGGGSTFGGSGG